MGQNQSYWRKLPLTYLIVEALERRGGSSKDIDLYKEIAENVQLTYSEFLKALMILEMQGIIYTETIGRDLRNIQLRKRP